MLGPWFSNRLLTRLTRLPLGCQLIRWRWLYPIQLWVLDKLRNWDALFLLEWTECLNASDMNMHSKFFANDRNAHQHTGVASCCLGRPWECVTRGSLETALDSWFLAEDLCVAQWQALHRNLYHYISLNGLGIVFHYTAKVTSLLQICVSCFIERQLCLSRDSTDSCSRYLLLWIHWNDVQCNCLCRVPTRWSMVLHWRLSL